MASAGNILFAAAVASVCLSGGWSMEGQYFRKVNDHLKRAGGNNHPPHHSPVLTNTGNNAQTSYDFCSTYQEYNTLLQLKNNTSCLRSTDVWPLLESLNQRNPVEGPKCRVYVIGLLSDAFWDIDASPVYCQCHGYVNISNFPNRDQQIYHNCWNVGTVENTYYQKIYNEYYKDVTSYGRQCTHHHIWYPLSEITDVTCQGNLITNLAHTFTQYVPAFECSEVSSVQQSTHQVESTTSTPTTTHTPEITTTHTPETTTTHTPEITTTHTPETTTIYKPQTTQPRAIQTCDKYATITSLAYGTMFSHPAASDCSPNDHKASEALVFQLCHTNDIHSWIKGAEVLDNCSQIPLYAPVATFSQDSFVPLGGQAGIFLGCLPNGFKLAAQVCFANATVLHIEKGGQFTRDPSIYHVVLF